MGKKDLNAKSPGNSHQQLAWVKEYDTVLQIDKGKQRKTKISHTCENADNKMKILCSGLETEMVPSLWDEVWKMQQNEPLQRVMQKSQRQHSP